MGLSNLKHVSFFDEMVFPYMEKLTLISSKYLIGLLINMRATLKNDGITDENVLSMSIGYCRGLNDNFRIRYIIFNYANAVGDVISIPYNFQISDQNYLHGIYDKYLNELILSLQLVKSENPVVNPKYQCVEIHLSNVDGLPNYIKNVSYEPTSAEEGKLLVSVSLDLMNFSLMQGGKSLSYFQHSFYSDSHFESCQRLCHWAESFGMGDSESGIVKKALSELNDSVINLCRNRQSDLRRTGNLKYEHDLFLLDIATTST